MTFADAKVGDELGVKSLDPSSFECHCYASVTVRELRDDRLVTTKGAFMKDTGQRPPGPGGCTYQVLVSKAELVENNRKYFEAQRFEALTKSIHELTDQVSNNAEGITLLEKVKSILQSQTKSGMAPVTA
jgi:hypothetical protein